MCKETGKYDIEGLKNRLCAYKEIRQDISNQRERLDQLEMRITSVGGQVLSDMPKAPSPVPDRIADMIAIKIDLENDIKTMEEKATSERKWIEKLVSCLSKANEKAVIRMRYIDAFAWYDIAAALFGGIADYNDRSDSYLRRIFNLHGNALYRIAKTLSEKPKTDDAS